MDQSILVVYLMDGPHLLSVFVIDSQNYEVKDFTNESHVITTKDPTFETWTSSS